MGALFGIGALIKKNGTQWGALIGKGRSLEGRR